MYMVRQKTQNSPHNTEREEQRQRTDSTQLQDLLWSYDNQDSMKLLKDLKKKQQQPSNLFYKGAKAIWWNKDNFFNKSCWNKWISACKKKKKKKVNLDTNLIPFTNINSKYITDLNLTCKTMRVLEDNMGEISYDFENGNYFLDTTLKKWSMEEIIDKLDFIESKNILWKRISRKLKDKTQI